MAAAIELNYTWYQKETYLLILRWNEIAVIARWNCMRPVKIPAGDVLQTLTSFTT
jgi:hypothetical protein